MNTMNYSNPIEHNISPVEQKKYTVKIICVVDDYTDAGTVVIQGIRTHTHNSGAIYQTRIYNSLKHSKDRDYITRLPAFHGYVNGIYNRTFYPNTRPLQHINECIELCIKIDENRKERREIFYKMYRTFIDWITRKKAKVEKPSERFQCAEVIPVSEWN